MKRSFLKNLLGGIDLEGVWDALACHGAPLTVLGEASHPVSEASLIQTLILATDDLENRSKQADHFRKDQALASLLLALHDHYPQVYAALPEKVKARLPDPVEGRHIKMRRIASARLAAYL